MLVLGIGAPSDGGQAHIRPELFILSIQTNLKG
jgi:hypothetical protein